MTKVCPACGVEKDASGFAKAANRKDGLQVYCRPCHNELRRNNGAAKRWYERNKESERERGKARYWANREERREKARQYYIETRERQRESSRTFAQRMKMEAFTAYGGAICACCGEAITMFLSIDHINGCTAAERKEQGVGTGFYCWLKRNGYPPGFRVLCFNCNNGRRINGGVCPHVSLRS